MNTVMHCLLGYSLGCGLLLLAGQSEPPIAREALVRRHNPVVHGVDVDAPLTVGNGGFAFTADVTGLQTFSGHYHRWGIPTETMARWAWVRDPNSEHYTLADASRLYAGADGGEVAYPTLQSTAAGDWLRKNPRMHPLARLAFDYAKTDGTQLLPGDIQEAEQELDLWRGTITSRFKLEDVPVSVVVACHPGYDLLGFRIESRLVEEGRLRVELGFPRGYDVSIKNTPPLDWSQPDLHRTRLVREGPGWGWLRREVMDLRYGVVVSWMGNAVLEESGAHRFLLSGEKAGDALEFTVGFYPALFLPARFPSVAEVRVAAADYWSKYWERGAAVDFSGSTDPRAGRIEERIILSRYLMAVQETGEVPAQESGLTCSTWYGKHHTEMIWWHAAHFALWGNGESLAVNLEWYRARLPEARRLAASRGLRGARWAKMVGPEGRESPGGNPLIIWNQPHMVYLCELVYREDPSESTLERYRDLVLETADCMASMVHFDEEEGRYVLGPPLWIAQEIYDPAESRNPSFELAYWRWALGVAQRWCERLGMGRNSRWDDIVGRLSELPAQDGKYVALESFPDTWDNPASRHDHPTMLAPLGLLPGFGVDPVTMQRTLEAVMDRWDWEAKIWGWDYPMIAMTAARLGRPETAVDILLREGPNNIYMLNGHCPQRSDEAKARGSRPGAHKREIAAYLPANGAFLSAVALMVAGWDGCEESFPGFPKDGRWVIRAEGLSRLP